MKTFASDIMLPGGQVVGNETRNATQSLIESFSTRSSAGVTVTEATALGLSTVWACVDAISQDVAKLPLFVYRRLPDDTRERATDVTAYRILKTSPNTDMTAIDFRQCMTANCLLWGNAYAEIVRRNNGELVEFIPWHPSRTRPYRLATGEIFYEYRYQDGRKIDVPARDMLHIKGMSGDGLVGRSVIQQAREAFGAVMATERFGATWFGNGSRPSGTLKHPGKLSDTGRENLRESWNRLHSGPTNANRVAILEEGLEFTPMSVPPDDAQFLQTRQFQVTDVCRWFRVPPSKIQDHSRSTFTNIEHIGIEWVTDTLMTWLIRWEQELNRKIFPVESDLYAEHDVKSLLRGDNSSRATFYRELRNLGVLSANEIRRAENMNPIEGGDGYWVPQNVSIYQDGTLTPANAPGETNNEQNQQGN